MSDLVMQHTFNSGEWAPALNARVDLQKYHNGAALIRNFFVDYRGGITTRTGTQYVIQAKSISTVRLIPFQASFAVSYMLEFSSGYIRFINNGSPVLEAGIAITGASQANPGVITAPNSYGNGDWVFLSNINGMTQLNGNYYIIANRTPTTFTLTDLNGNAISTIPYNAYISGGNAQRIYTINSPYTASDLASIKFSQNVNQMILCSPNHAPYFLTLTSANNWTLNPITFGATIAAPVGQAVASTFAAGTINYAYVITAVDANGQESGPSGFAAGAFASDIRTVAGTNTVTWTAVAGAVSYNVYRAQIRYGSAVPAGAQFGFIGNCTAVTFIDSNIGPNYSLTPPIPTNPFSGSGVQSVTVTNSGSGSYNNLTVPSVSFTGGGGGSGAQATATLYSANVSLHNSGLGYNVGDILPSVSGAPGLSIQVLSTNFNGGITGFALLSNSFITSGTASTPVVMWSLGGAGSAPAQMDISWALYSIGVTNPGTGYGPAPNVVLSNGSGAAVATLGSAGVGNPTVPGFFQQRLVLAGPVSSPQQFNMSKPGAEFNFDISQIAQADDAISGTLVSGQLNTIQSMIAQPAGLIMFSDKQSWLINGGVGAGSPISALQLTANAQSFNGASGPPPIVATNNILFVQSKGSIVRDLAFSIYTSVYSGIDISAISSHLFYGFTILEWAWAEEPFKLVWAVRNDGQLLCLTYLKEQDFVAWSHSDTNGLFKSVGTVQEPSVTGSGYIDAVYFIVQRTVNGNTVQYIERLTDIKSPQTLSSAWQVDAGLVYNGPAVLTFNGAQHLAGMTVTGVATTDNGVSAAITPFTMPVNSTGTFTLPAPALPATGYTRVLIGLSFTPQFQTLAIDTGSPTIQGKVKVINYATLRVREALGLSIGSDFNHLVPMKDLILGNVSSMLVGQSSQIITGLVTGDARTFLDPTYTVPGQFCVQQSQPFPASILGVIPNVVVGDLGSRGQ